MIENQNFILIQLSLSLELAVSNLTPSNCGVNQSEIMSYLFHQSTITVGDQLNGVEMSFIGSFSHNLQSSNS